MPKIPISELTLPMLGDGYAGKAIAAGLEVINRDLIERGDDGKPRKLAVNVTFIPSPNGRCEIDVQVKTTCPAFRPPATVAKYDQKAGGFVFNPDASENPDQMTIPDDVTE